MKVLLTTLNAKYSHSALALYSLAAYCRQFHGNIVIDEYTINQPLPHIVSRIYQHQPTVIAIACYIWNIKQVLELCSIVKKILPKSILVLGGPEVSYDAEQILNNNPAVDHIVCGEGELALEQLLTALQSTDQPAIVGVASRSLDGTIIKADYQQITTLAQLPFAYTESDLMMVQEKIIYYESSRGCPFSCQYCLSGNSKNVRFYPLQRVLSELKVFIDHNVRQVKFVDRTFNAKPEHYLPILEFLAHQDCRTNFHLEVAADLLTEAALEILTTAPAGRFQLEIGIQSTYEPTLAAVKRHHQWYKLVENVKRLRQAGNVHLHLDLIVGLPFETIERFADSFNTVYKLQPQMLQIGFLKLLKGSGLRRTAHLHDCVYNEAAPYEILSNRYLNYSEIYELQLLEDVFNHTYNSGRFITTLRYLVSWFSGDAFYCYRCLTKFWVEHDMQLVAHSPKTIVDFIRKFCLETLPTNIAANSLELLRFDLLQSTNLRPEILPWQYPKYAEIIGAFWRNQSQVQQYLPQFKFSSWRNIHQQYQIEKFKVDIPLFLASGRLEMNSIVLLFCFEPENNNTWLKIDDLHLD